MGADVKRMQDKRYKISRIMSGGSHLRYGKRAELVRALKGCSSGGEGVDKPPKSGKKAQGPRRVCRHEEPDYTRNDWKREYYR